MRSERIICAAIKDKQGNISIGLRHGGAYGRYMEMFPEYTTSDMHPMEEGFVTTRLRFVDRIKAAIIAKREGQITSDDFDGHSLLSEDLYSDEHLRENNEDF